MKILKLILVVFMIIITSSAFAQLLGLKQNTNVADKEGDDLEWM